MAVLEPEALNPRFTGAFSSISGAVASNVRNEINTKISAQNTNSNVAVGALESLQRAMGNGALSGGTISAGVGLSVSIAAFEALVGTYIGNDAASTVGGLEPNAVNYIFARQNGEWTVNQDGADPTTTQGDFLLWGTATTDATSVTAVNNNRRHFQKFARLSKSVAGAADVTLTTAEACNRTLELTGALTGNINLLLPLFDGAEYVVFNNTSGAFTLTVKGSTGTGIAVGQGKTAILRSDGTNYLRVTADNP